jgi:hypothetical protein
MGTFHQGKHELHGITVVVDTDGPEVYVGRCDDVNAGGIILHDADVHVDGNEGRSKAEYVRDASRFGVWPKHRLLVVDGTRVTSVRRLGEVG